MTQLQQLLSGRNLGLARSAREALDKMYQEDDSLRVRKAAGDALGIVAATGQAASVPVVEPKQAEPALPEKAEAARVAAIAEAGRKVGPAAELATKRFTLPGFGPLGNAFRARTMQAKGVAPLAAHIAATRKPVAASSAAQPAADAKPHAAPRWRAVAWITFVFAIAFLLLSTLPNGSPPGTVIVYSLYGAVLGFAVAGALYLEKTLRQPRSILWIALAWGVGHGLAMVLMLASGTSYFNWPDVSVLVPGLDAATGGAVAGLATVLVLRRERVLSGPVTTMWVTLGWAIAGALFWGAAWELFLYTPISNGAAPFVLSAALQGAAGSAIMIWQIRQAMAIIAPDAAVQQNRREPVAQSLVTAAPGWLSAQWIALGFGISTLLVLQSSFGAAANVVLNGMLSGLVVGLALYLSHTFTQRKSILWVALGWGLAWAIAGSSINYLLDNGWGYEFSYRVTLTEGISGAIAGAVIALVLALEDRALRRNTLLGIALAWGIAGLANAVIFMALYNAMIDPSGMDFTPSLAIAAVANGAIGALLMIFLLRMTFAKRTRA